MKYFTILFLTGVLITVPFCNFGNESQSTKTEHQKTALYIDSVKVFHIRKPVFIPVKGVLEPWKQIKLFLPDSARLISVLVEPGSNVKQGDLLASLWLLNRRGENTPVDLTAPVSGRIEEVCFGLNQLVPAFRPVLSIVNSEHLVLYSKLKTGYSDLIKKGMTVTLQVLGEEYKAVVKSVDLSKKKIEISFYNRDEKIPAGAFTHGYINCGMQKGDFVEAVYFLNKDSLKIQLSDSIPLTLFPEGRADSLIQIYPPLPGQDFIRIYQKNLDL